MRSKFGIPSRRGFGLRSSGEKNPGIRKRNPLSRRAAPSRTTTNVIEWKDKNRLDGMECKGVRTEVSHRPKRYVYTLPAVLLPHCLSARFN